MNGLAPSYEKHARDILTVFVQYCLEASNDEERCRARGGVGGEC